MVAGRTFFRSAPQRAKVVYSFVYSLHRATGAQVFSGAACPSAEMQRIDGSGAPILADVADVELHRGVVGRTYKPVGHRALARDVEVDKFSGIVLHYASESCGAAQ